ncbi:MAG: hypothetical protein AB2A00_24545 [Myxococcota bacterium]
MAQRSLVITMRTVIASLVLLCSAPALLRADTVTLPTSVDVRDGFTVPSPVGREARMIADAQAGRGLDMVDAALLASGVPESALKQQRERLVAAVRPVVERAARKKDPLARGKALLSGLHAALLRRYDANATEITRALETGEFNCVSSAVLFVIAAQGLLDNPRAMLTSTHAFARVTVEGRAVDVEATSPHGFDPDRKKIFTPAFVEQLGIGRTLDGRPADPVNAHKNAVELPAVSLVAAIYGNRAVDLVKRGDARAAAVALDRATRMGQGPQKTRLAEWRATILVNAAADLMEQNRHADAVPLLQLGLDGVSDDKRGPLLHNLALCYGKLGEELLDKGEPQEALRWFELARGLGVSLPSVEARRQKVLAALAAREGNDKRCEGQDSPTESAPAKAAAGCLAELSRVRLERKDYDGSVAAARKAVSLSPSEVNARIAVWNALNQRGFERCEQDRPDLAERDYKEAERYREVAVKGSPSLAVKAGSCWGAAASRMHQRGDAKLAEAWLFRALMHQPDDDALRHNLAVSQLARARSLIDQRSCDEARPLVVSAAHWAPDVADNGRKLLASCAFKRAMVPWQEKRWGDVVEELRRGLRDAPDSVELRKNLASALHNAAIDHYNAGDCGEAMALVKEARGYGLGAEAEALEQRCR